MEFQMNTRGSHKRQHSSVLKDSRSLACYCLGKRTVGKSEVFCKGCSMWFHQVCLMDLTAAEMGSLPFRVCYKFKCRKCSSTNREEWSPTYHIVHRHVVITSMANVTACQMQANKRRPGDHEAGTVFVSFDSIVEFTHKNWGQLSRQRLHTKEEVAALITKAIANNPDLFLRSSKSDDSVALNIALVDVSPAHEASKQIYKPTIKAPEVGGPQSKKGKRPPKRNLASASRAVFLEDSQIPPTTLVNQIFYGVEKDPNATLTTYNNQEYRIITHPEVLLSQNDKDEDLNLSHDRLIVSGYEGHRIVRATHSVAKGTWYYEAKVLSLLAGSSIRIGWAREEVPLGSSLGFTKYTYSWRSLKGTKFHDGKGKTYQPGGYKEGDVLGILIHLPFDTIHPGVPSKYYLPPSRKNCHMVGNLFKSFKRFFDYQKCEAAGDFMEFPGSKIEFFLNGVSCGVAFEDIYRGIYYPAVSLYSENCQPSIQFNFGPSFRHLPPGAHPMSHRAEELPAEQTLSDVLFLVQSCLDGDVDQDTDY